MKFNERLRALRESKKLTQQNLADILSISKSTYVKYERGEREPKFDTLAELSRFYEVSIDYILGHSNESNRDMDAVNRVIRDINNHEFLEGFGKFQKAVTRMMAVHTQSLYDLDYGFVLDVFYMSLTLEDFIHQIYNKGLLIFCYNELMNVLPPPNESSFLELNEMIKNLRKLVDDYICLLQSPKFYKPDELGREYYFEEDILNYGKKTEDE